jgi:hypothetical protein
MAITQLIIEAIYTSGVNLYAIITNRLNGQIWNNSTLAFEVFNSANWASYAVALTEQSPTGKYIATRPAGTAGYVTSESIYVRAGASPATSDAPPISLLKGAGENSVAISGDASVAPTNLQAALSTEEQGTVLAGTITNTSFPTSLIASANNTYLGRSILFVTGAQAGNQAVIQAYTSSGAILVISPLPGAPAVGDAFIIV